MLKLEEITKRYNIIYLDPPWFYNKRNLTDRLCGGVHAEYPVMQDDELRALPVGSIAAKNCALCMWVTCPRLPLGVELIEKWGFRYATVGFCWVKLNPKSRNIFFGPGYYTGSNVELILLGIKGSMEPIDKSISQVIVSERMEHSHKPAEARERIVKMFGNLPRIELFARQVAPGWDGWGLDYDESTPLQEPIQNKLFGDIL